jgi:hypothetical protein
MACMGSPVRVRLAPPDIAVRQQRLVVRGAGSMKKRFLLTYLIFLIPTVAFSTVVVAYHIYHHGLYTGIFIVLLCWSGAILCIPAAHGRMLVGMPAKVLFKKTITPEIFFWLAALLTNVYTLLVSPGFYMESAPTTLLYRIIMHPSLWIVFAIGFIGTWYRAFVGKKSYYAHESIHTLVRHFISLIGICLFLYVIRYDLVILVNSAVTG